MEDIRLALFAMAPLKPPGPDGLPPMFFQKYWEFVKEDLFSLVVDFFKTGCIAKELNRTYICLIPKVGAPETADQFHPISLCNVAFKIITKLVADRLHGILDQLIASNQSAFIPNRLISDNVMVAHEMFHYIKKQKRGKQNFLALKHDMRKAYDRLEWNFVEGMLLRMGFNHFWVDRVMACITTVSYSLLINGFIKGSITPTRGIRQGDPISLTIFILCSQALTAVLKQAKAASALHGEVNALKECLDLYCTATGQSINLQKSSLTFSPNTHTKFKRWFSRVLKVKYGDGPSKYLGLPTNFGVSKKVIFQDVQEKTINKLQGWKGKLLSPVDFKVHTQRPVGCTTTQVADLIDPISRSWRTSLLHRYLQPDEVNAILKISLSIFVEEDSQVWGASQTGAFLVKSAYHLLARKEGELQFKTSHMGDDSKIGLRIWKIQTLPKIKNFIWRTCNEGVGTASGFLSKQIPIDPSCLRCGAEVETGDHLLLDCPFARAVWFGSTLQYSPLTDVRPTLVDWLHSWEEISRMDNRKARESLSRASSIIWYLWRARNELAFHSKQWSPTKVISMAEKAFLEYADVWMPSRVGSAPSPSHNNTVLQRSWTAPPSGFIKVNCDTALPVNSSKGGLGVVFRDHNGMQGRCVSIPHSFGTASQGELLTIHLALKLALESGFTQIQLESDCKEAVDFIHDQDRPPLPILLWCWLISEDLLPASLLSPFFVSHGRSML
ncbi:uncharacterized protein LOC122663178 [Telopea speciosissima]|uniref:uncharacterized protein LOC122663178 n=1 Tax=Telopea speciosissima TaxID=54955 RepID=UPI001CC5DA97|nr:uncharacterized protein LOC122663178 [Telopea speciosissima]